MPCSLFRSAGADCRCAAVVDVVVPSLFERERYCRGEQADSCPVREAYRDAGGPISEDDYWRIWLAPDDEPTTEVHTPDPRVCM